MDLQAKSKGRVQCSLGNSGRPILPGVDLHACAKLCASAIILCADFEEVIQRAVKGDVVYADPPYTLSHKNNGFMRYNDILFSWDDEIRPAEACKRAIQRGTFVVLSGTCHEDILSIYPGWWALKVSRKTLVSRIAENRREVFEVLIFSRKPRLPAELLKGLQRI